VRVQGSRAAKLSAMSPLARRKDNPSPTGLSESRDCRDEERIVCVKDEEQEREHDSAARSKALTRFDNVQEGRGTTNWEIEGQ